MYFKRIPVGTRVKEFPGRLLSSETPRCMPTLVHAYSVLLPEGETMHPFAGSLACNSGIES